MAFNIPRDTHQDLRRDTHVGYETPPYTVCWYVYSITNHVDVMWNYV